MTKLKEVFSFILSDVCQKVRPEAKIGCTNRNRFTIKRRQIKMVSTVAGTNNSDGRSDVIIFLTFSTYVSRNV